MAEKLGIFSISINHTELRSKTLEHLQFWGAHSDLEHSQTGKLLEHYQLWGASCTQDRSKKRKARVIIIVCSIQFWFYQFWEAHGSLD